MLSYMKGCTSYIVLGKHCQPDQNRRLGHQKIHIAQIRNIDRGQTCGGGCEYSVIKPVQHYPMVSDAAMEIDEASTSRWAHHVVSNVMFFMLDGNYILIFKLDWLQEKTSQTDYLRHYILFNSANTDGLQRTNYLINKYLARGCVCVVGIVGIIIISSIEPVVITFGRTYLNKTMTKGKSPPKIKNLTDKWGISKPCLNS